MLHTKRTSRILLGALGTAFAAGCGVSIAPPTIGFTAPQIVYRRPVIYTPPPYYAPPAVVSCAGGRRTSRGGRGSGCARALAADPQLDLLVALIALYPDPLLAQFLPATTYPEQVQAAGQWLAAHPNPPDDAVEAQQWSPNVKALVRYPAALQVLNNDIAWMQSLGSAFNREPAAVMAAIQDMRAQAQAAGNLVAGAQVKVIADAGVISIQPVEITAPMFVPVYDPVAVYVSPVAITWGQPYAVGPWLVNGVDWYGGAVFAGPWYGGWYHDGYWGRDYGWHYDHYRQGWRHEDRFGRAPHLDRAHFAGAGASAAAKRISNADWPSMRRQPTTRAARLEPRWRRIPRPDNRTAEKQPVSRDPGSRLGNRALDN